MERLAGQTLKLRIAGGSLPTEELLRLADQIAEALEAAHGAGIVHRDIKPSNLFVTVRGDAKVLDLGLARRDPSASSRAVDASTATSQGELTEPGVAPGTGAYMSPEQVLGRKLDARTDIFSFGVVLYEMATGRAPFAGERGLFDEILNLAPTPAMEHNPRLPAELSRIVDKCLEKDRELRYQSMKDLRSDLRRSRRDAASADYRSARPRSIRALAWPVLAVTLAAVIGALYWWGPADRRVTADPVTILPFTSDGGLRYAPNLSPEGERVAYSWTGQADDNWDVYVKAMGSGSAPLRLTDDPANDFGPVWSPDGRQIAFVREAEGRSAIYVVPSLGGSQRKLVDLEGPFTVASYVVPRLSWSPDGTWLAFSDKPREDQPARIFRLSLERLDRSPLTSPPQGSFGDLSPELSPDGSEVAFVRGAGLNQWGGLDVWVQAIGSHSTS